MKAIRGAVLVVGLGLGLPACKSDPATGPTEAPVDLPSLGARVRNLEAAVAQAASRAASAGAALEARVAQLEATRGSQQDELQRAGERLSALEVQAFGLGTRLLALEALDVDAKLAATAQAMGQMQGTVVALGSQVDGLATQVTPLGGRVGALEGKTASLFAEAVDGQPSLVFRGVNVHIQNGLGTTLSQNGRGNLVVGYNRARADASDNNRSGSHNLVIGDEHNFPSFGGLAVGEHHGLSGGYGAITGGFHNEVFGAYSAIVGGSNNWTGINARYSTVSAGHWNSTAAVYASVSGGSDNGANGEGASVCGGLGNTASGQNATVGGGQWRAAATENSWTAGGLHQDH